MTLSIVITVAFTLIGLLVGVKSGDYHIANYREVESDGGLIPHALKSKKVKSLAFQFFVCLVASLVIIIMVNAGMV